MPSRRVQKAAEAVREVVSWAILTELNDPRVRDVTVTYVEMSGDLRQAKVHVSIMGDDTKQNLSLRGLQPRGRLPPVQTGGADRYAIHPADRVRARPRREEVDRDLAVSSRRSCPSRSRADDSTNRRRRPRRIGELDETASSRIGRPRRDGPDGRGRPETNPTGEPPGPEAREPTS